MSESNSVFTPSPLLLAGPAHSLCRASVVIPARDEEVALPTCLDALHRQVDLSGNPMRPATFEIILLLNNCTDRSAAVARAWKASHPAIVLHIEERNFPLHAQNVGTARRLLMNTAWRRLCRLTNTGRNFVAILCTDADTAVAPDWLARNLRAHEAGADVVGGKVELLPQDFRALPASVQHCYRQDRRYAALVAQLEDLLDPRPGDRWPRHLDHFGASLSCTPEAYAAAGGMPAQNALEDEAFVDRVRRANLCLRHEPAVRVYTSARLAGRAAKGMAGQLRMWSELPCPDAHTVPSAAFLAHRFGRMHQLRRIFSARSVGDLTLPSDWWRETFRRALDEETTCPAFLGAIYCDILIAESFLGVPEEPIAEAVRHLQVILATLPPVIWPATDVTDGPIRSNGRGRAHYEASISSESLTADSELLQ